jgi:hypothetical protein
MLPTRPDDLRFDRQSKQNRVPEATLIGSLPMFKQQGLGFWASVPFAAGQVCFQ